MKWDIEFEHIPVNNTDDSKRIKVLKDRGESGWEPYAVVGITHYFKKPIEDKPKQVIKK